MISLMKSRSKKNSPSRNIVHDHDTAPYTTGWVYDVLAVDNSTKKNLFKVCFVCTLFIVYSFTTVTITRLKKILSFNIVNSVSVVIIGLYCGNYSIKIDENDRNE